MEGEGVPESLHLNSLLGDIDVAILWTIAPGTWDTEMDKSASFRFD